MQVYRTWADRYIFLFSNEIPQKRKSIRKAQSNQFFFFFAGRLSASDMPTPTSLAASSQLTSSLLSSASILANSSLPGSISSGSSSLLSSPTKLSSSNMGSLQRNSSCSVAERGVPEGAASAPSHDYVSASSSSSSSNPHMTTSQSVANSYADNSGGNIVDAQNPVYYAMNV